MKKFFVVFTAFAFVMAMGLPALAEMEVSGSTYKTLRMRNRPSLLRLRL